ncbi:hypothetical protein ALQ54_05717 [Pseudomonas syringae]|nr:hypothetical protein ALQ54_05717 [Pseudomonas syringae]
MTFDLEISAASKASAAAGSGQVYCYALQTTKPHHCGFVVVKQTGLLIGQFVLQVVDVDSAFAEAFIAGQVAVQRDVGLDPVDHDFVQGVAHACHGLFAGRAPSDHFTDQRVIVGRYLVAAVQVRIDPYAVAARCVEMLDQTRAWYEGLRVFGVDPAFQRMTLDDHVILGVRQFIAGGDAEHLLDDVDACDHFRNRVLHLNTGVHFDEVETTVFVQELERTRTAIADIDTRLDAGSQNILARLFIDERCWRFFQNLLVTALQRAVAIAQVDSLTLAVGNHLDFHVTWVGQVFFQVDHRVAEPGGCFGAGLRRGFDQVFFAMNHTHTATTTATGGLDDHRVTDFTANAQSGVFVFRQRAVGTGNGRYIGQLHGVLGRNLVAHQANGVCFWTDESEARFFNLFGEVGVLGEKPVTRVDRRGAGHFGSRNDRRNVQVGQIGRCRTDADGFVCQAQVHQLAICGGVYSDGLDAQFFTGTQDAQGNFAAVGDQNFFQHRRLSPGQTIVNSGWSNSTG